MPTEIIFKNPPQDTCRVWGIFYVLKMRFLAFSIICFLLVIGYFNTPGPELGCFWYNYWPGSNRWAFTAKTANPKCPGLSALSELAVLHRLLEKASNYMAVLSLCR